MLRTLQVLHVTLQETCIFYALLGKCSLCSEYISCWYLEQITLTYLVPCLVIANRGDWWEQIRMGMHMAKWESYNVCRSMCMMLFFFLKKTVFYYYPGFINMHVQKLSLVRKVHFVSLWLITVLKFTMVLIFASLVRRGPDWLRSMYSFFQFSFLIPWWKSPSGHVVNEVNE